MSTAIKSGASEMQKVKSEQTWSYFNSSVRAHGRTDQKDVGAGDRAAAAMHSL